MRDIFSFIPVQKPPSKMRVPDFILNCVGYIGPTCGDRSRIEDIVCADGTAFVIGVPSEIAPGFYFKYVVTAKHTLAGIRRDAVFMTNGPDGKLSIVPLIGEWIHHPTDTVCDLAVRPIDLDSTTNVLTIPRWVLLDTLGMEEKQIGIGDEVFLPGLFGEIAGLKNLHPIVRHGTIAMLPKEQIDTPHGYSDAYLMEVRSIGGLSGSPVFARQTVSYGPPGIPDHADWIYGLGGRHFIIGVIRGHWDIDEAELNDPHAKHKKRGGVNMGIGIITPAFKLLETLDHPRLLEARRVFDEKLRRFTGSPV